jgi:hypothetical protein
MRFCQIPYGPPLSPPETGGERTINFNSKPKNMKGSRIVRPPLQKGDKRGINFDHYKSSTK